MKTMSDYQCKACAYSGPGLAYPMLFCNLRGVLVNPTFTCQKFKAPK